MRTPENLKYYFGGSLDLERTEILRVSPNTNDLWGKTFMASNKLFINY
jgi:hypothetical protein